MGKREFDQGREESTGELWVFKEKMDLVEMWRTFEVFNFNSAEFVSDGIKKFHLKQESLYILTSKLSLFHTLSDKN